MFRSGVDMTDFPALGSVNSSLNQSASATSPRSSIVPNRFGSYASTAGTSAGSTAQVQASNRQFDDQFGGFSPQGSAALGGYNMGLHSLSSQHAGSEQSPSATQRMSSRTFTADEFPALKDHSSLSRPEGPMSSAMSLMNGFGQSNKQHELGIANTSTQWNRDQLGLDTPNQQSLHFAAPGSRKGDLSLSGDDSIHKLSRDVSAVNLEGSGSSQMESAPDPYGLLGLLGVIRMTDPDLSMLALGSDLTTLGLDLNTPDSIYSTFISPWSDNQTPAGLNIEPEFHLPACYRSVQATPPAQQRMRTFSDEILFYVFYCLPRDVAQEAAAQELYARNWRYHKELGLWLTKEPDESGRPVQPFRRTSPNAYERDVYVFFDPSTWQKIKREYTLLWDSIEDRSQPMQGMGMNSSGISPGVSNRGVMI
ncbi:transcriptional regulator [Umbelopsis sp. WA50703]